MHFAVYLRVPLSQNSNARRLHHDPAAVAHQGNVLAGRRTRRRQEHMDHIAQSPRNADATCHSDSRARHTVPGAGRTKAVDPARRENVRRSAATIGCAAAAMSAL